MDILTFILAMAFAKKFTSNWALNSDGYSIGVDGHALTIIANTTNEESDT